MRKNDLLGHCVCLCLAIFGCGPESAEEIKTAGGAENRLHLVPFQCRYLGISISELDGCFIACPGRVFQDYDLRQLSSFLECTHPAYSFLRCSLDTRH